MKIQDKELNQLQKEIEHILDSGANSIRLLNMFETFVQRHGEKFIKSKTSLCNDNKQLLLFAEWLQYNGKWDSTEKQVNKFLHEQKQN